MKAFIFGSYSLGDKIILETIKKSLSVQSQYLGQTVDLSLIKPVDYNLIVIVNRTLFKIDMDRLIAYANKEPNNPMIVVNKVKTFGAVGFSSFRKIEKIFANKIFLFSGVLYLPKEYFRPTMGDIFKNLDLNKDRVRVYIL